MLIHIQDGSPPTNTTGSRTLCVLAMPCASVQRSTGGLCCALSCSQDVWLRGSEACHVGVSTLAQHVPSCMCVLPPPCRYRCRYRGGGALVLQSTEFGLQVRQHAFTTRCAAMDAAARCCGGVLLGIERVRDVHDSSPPTNAIGATQWCVLAISISSAQRSTCGPCWPALFCS